MSSSRIQFLILQVLLCFCLASSSEMQSVYCRTAHCGQSNIACRNNGSFSSSCLPYLNMVSLAPYKNHLLHIVNLFRNRAAAGYTQSLYPAGRMARMVWSKELERFAQLYIKKCDKNLRPCMASSQFTIIGSIYDGLSFSGQSNLYSLTEITTELLRGWIQDARFVSREMLLQLTNGFRSQSVRISALLMADRNTHMGCSGMRHNVGIVNNFYMACAFATDNMRNKAIYRVYPEPGKLCKERDATYTNLCAIGEKYNNQHKYQYGEVFSTSSEILDRSLV